MEMENWERNWLLDTLTAAYYAAGGEPLVDVKWDEFLARPDVAPAAEHALRLLREREPYWAATSIGLHFCGMWKGPDPLARPAGVISLHQERARRKRKRASR